jgi:hypothetical protein
MAPKFEEYFAARGIDVKVRRAGVADPQYADLQKQQGNDLISTERFPGVARFLRAPYEGVVSEHIRSRMHDAEPQELQPLDGYFQFRKGIAERMEGDKELDDFLASLGPIPPVGATPPGQKRHDGERVATDHQEAPNQRPQHN